MSKQSLLYTLNCSNNKQLASILIPKNNQLRGLECYSCKLDGKALNSVFTKLFEVPKDNPGYEKTYFISYYGNPGEENCDKGLLKGWYIVKDPTDK